MGDLIKQLVYPYLKRFARRKDIPSAAPYVSATKDSGALKDKLLAWLDRPSRLDGPGPIEVAGWVASTTPIQNITLTHGGNLKLVNRPDVAAAQTSYQYWSGFEGLVTPTELDGPILTLKIQLQDGIHHWTFPFALASADREKFKNRKLQRLLQNLRCPQCEGSIDSNSQQLRCASCGSIYEWRGEQVNFLPENLKKQFGIISTLNVSQNDYDEHAIAIIQRYHDGLILDCGAGFRSAEYPNVINFEIVPYPSTDILGINERLPFKDNTFDAVFSLAVLEHVQDPFASAKEIARVLKPGGTLYCVVPFLQPLHGYPHHYYNMTSTGLANLFSKQITITEYGVLKSGLPIWSLTWFLRNWVDGLQGKTREQFLQMRVADLIGEPGSYLKSDFVTALSEEKNLELASTTMVLGRKKAVGAE